MAQPWVFLTPEMIKMDGWYGQYLHKGHCNMIIYLTTEGDSRYNTATALAKKDENKKNLGLTSSVKIVV